MEMPVPAATIAPARRVRGRLTVPGDKSIAHRYALLAALAEGRSTLTHFAPGADCRSTLACLRGLGVEVDEGEDCTVTLLGRGFGQLRSPAAPLDAGNSGTTLRLLAGVLAGHPFQTSMIGPWMRSPVSSTRNRPRYRSFANSSTCRLRGKMRGSAATIPSRTQRPRLVVPRKQ